MSAATIKGEIKTTDRHTRRSSESVGAPRCVVIVVVEVIIKAILVSASKCDSVRRREDVVG